MRDRSVEHAQGLIHLCKRDLCLGEVLPDHLGGEVPQVVLIKLEDLLEGLHVDHVRIGLASGGHRNIDGADRADGFEGS